MGLSVLPSCYELILEVAFESLQGNKALCRVDGDIVSFQIVERPLEFFWSFRVRLASS